MPQMSELGHSRRIGSDAAMAGLPRKADVGIVIALVGSGPTALIATFERSTERQGRSKLIVIHTRKIIAGVHVPGPAEEELVKCFRRGGTQGIIDAS